MLIIALILFTLAVIPGIYLFSLILKNKNTPKGLALIHGILASSGIVVLLIFSFLYFTPWLLLTLFILTASGGVTLFILDLCGYQRLKPVAIAHAFVALLAIILFIQLIFG